ncbi:MAG: ParB/RepB/Spo0J family partition protein [Myxococcota bacterium]
MSLGTANGARRPALGRGLSALIPPKPAAPGEAGPQLPATPGVLMLGIETIQPSRSQPRKNFDEAALQELASSISEHGILQPVVVRKSVGSSYELVAGERRWRAAQRAGLKEVPAVLKDVAPQDVLTLALVENLQRADLNPIEEAEAYKNLVEELKLTQEEVAKRVGKDRTTITNSLRLLKLPLPVRDAVLNGALSMGHARAILALADAGLSQPEEAMNRAAREVMANNLSVRATEALVRARKADADRATTPDDTTTRSSASAAVRDLEDRLRQRLAVKSVVRANKEGKGTIELHFQTLDELDALLARMGVN